MIEDIKKFIADWIDGNIHPEGYQPEGNNTEAEQRAAECRAAGAQEGYSAADLDSAAADTVGGGDDLVDLMANAIEDANDRELDRQSAKDD